MAVDDARVEDARGESPASIRKLIASGSQRGLPPRLDKMSSRALLKHNHSLKRIEGVASPLRRPLTASSTHSRIHQALRRSESEFVFSSKQATVDGFLYSSRFQQTVSVRPSTTGTMPRPKHTQTSKVDKRANGSSSQPLLPQRSPTLTQHHPPLSKGSSLRDEVIPHSTESDIATNARKPRPLSSSHLLRKYRRDPISTVVAGSNPREEESLTTGSSIAKNDDGSYIVRKRRCARTFEEMIFARIQGIATKEASSLNNARSDDSSLPNKEDEDSSGGVDKLLADGIIASVIALSSLPDAATQSHCCRSLWYLAQVPSARKAMVSSGAVGTIKLLARSATGKARQDLAAALCHLCEDSSLVETMLFEGIDRCLVRLIGTTDSETKRICALAVFNISSDASKIKHFVDAYSQLLITSTKSSYGHTAASGYLMKAVYNVARLPMFHASLLGENIPRFLASQLPYMSGSIQFLALQALVSLCDAKANRAQILSQGFCKLLEKMLIVSNYDVQEMALLVLLLLSLDEGSRIKLCNWVPVGTFIHTALIRLNHQSRSSLVFLDSCIVRNLCDSVLTHHELLEDNAMPLLLDMSRTPDHNIKANAVCALVSIIASSPEETAEYVTEILDELITLTQSSQPRICLFAVGAIYNIACNDDCLPLLARSSDLVDCLRGLAIAPQQESVAELTAAVVYRIGTLEADKDSSVDASTLLLERDFVPVLVQLTRNFPAARGYAIQALLQLARDGTVENHKNLFPHGSDIIWELLCALNNESCDSNKPLASTCDDPAAARSAVALIAVLSQHRVNHRLLVKNGVVYRFLRSLRRVARANDSSMNDETIVLNSAYVFYSLAVSQEGCEQLVREQGIEEMIYIARTAKFADITNTHHVKELFMMTMCRVSSFIGLEVKLIEHGAIDAIMVLALVSSTDSTSIKALCIKTLANCLVAKNCGRPLIDHGVIWALASLVVVDSSDTRAACAVSLCNLATVPHMLGRFLDAGAPRALVHLLQRCESEQATALIVIKTIANLVANEKICLAFVNEDIEKHLGVYFASKQSSDEMRQLAAMVLLRVTSANDAVISLEHLKHGVFVWMEQIITMEDDALVKNCMLTVHDLTGSTTIDIAELDVDHILRIVIQVFQRHARSGDVLTMCLWILYNLSCQQRVLHELVRTEILDFLRHQVPAMALPFPLPYPTTGIAHLAASPSTLSLLNGAVAQSIDVKLCCYVLHNLSCARDGQDVLASLVNARMVAILSDIYLQRDDLKETCAVAACNLAAGRVNTTRVVDDRAGDLVIHFSFSTLFHRCHYHLVSVAIRKMVNAPGNQPVLLHRGVARAIVRVLELAASGGVADIITVRNLIASLCVLSKCQTHLQRLLQDGALPVVVAVSESKTITSSNSAIGGEILGYCFEILSELCSVDYEPFTSMNRGTGEAINVINTLTRLSELHHGSGSGGGGQTTATAASYYERGDDTTKCLAFAQLLTYMKKTPSTTNSVKKNLELQASFQVPARKWMPDAQPTPHDPPSLECCEIPLTEGSQSMPDEIKQRIRSLPSLPKEPLVRDESSEAVDPSANSLPNDANGDVSITPPNEESEQHEATARPFLVEIRSKKKQLQRGLAGRNLSLASTSSLLF